MSRTIRYHLDEHVDPAIAEGLRRRGIDVTTTIEARLASARDEAHLAYALSKGRVIVTFDEDFLELARNGIAHAGIAYRFQGNRLIGHMVRMLELYWELVDADEMQGKVVFL